MRLIGIQRAPPLSHLLPFDRPDLLSSTHPSDHNTVHFQSSKPADEKITITQYKNLARRKEREAKRTAQKAVKKAAKTQSNVSLPALLPPHTPRLALQTSGTVSGRPMYEYEAAFLIPVPLFFDASLGLGVGPEGCVAPDTYVIGPNGSCGGFNGGCVGSSGTTVRGSEPEFLFAYILVLK